MNDSESALFFELQKQLPSNHHIFPNMRLADIVDATNGYGFYKRRNKILPKHIDFVICDSFFKPIVAIELNGSSHNRLDRIEKDEEKREILEEAQLPFVIIRVGDNFNEAMLKIKYYL
jgi:very-short-patch-repair endonuclease